MSRLIIYTGKVPTPYMRFIDRESFMAWIAQQGLPPNRVYSIEVSGVNPYTTLYYIDVNLANIPDFKSLNWQSEIGYIQLVPDLTEQSFFAFVDRVERNEIDENSIRIYYKVDWWDTLLLNNTTPYIVGDVVRAHVNDIIRDENDNVVPTLDYTLASCECDTNTYNITYKQLTFPYGNTKKLLDNDDMLGTSSIYHIICTSALLDFSDLVNYPPVISHSKIEGKIAVTNSLYEVLIPINSEGLNVPFSTYSLLGGTTDFATNLKHINEIKTDNMVGVFTRNYIDGTHEVLQSDGSVRFNVTRYSPVKMSGSSGIDGEFAICRKISPYFSCYDISPNLTYGQLVNALNLNPSEITYNTYLKTGVIKYYSQMYNPLLILSQNKSFEIDYSFVKNNYGIDEVFGIYLNPTTNSFAVYCNSYRQLEESKYMVGQCNIVAPPPISDNYLDRLTAEQNASKATVKMVTNTVRGVSNSVATTITNPVKGLSQGINTAMDFVEDANNFIYETIKADLVDKGILVEGSLSSGLQASALGKNFPTILICHFSDEETLENLAFYGYNTHLQPKEIIKNHRRKYYNYIKTSSCSVISFTTTGSDGSTRSFNYSAEVKNDIENMLNGGVWLFNYNDMETIFELEVPNYPLSAGY